MNKQKFVGRVKELKFLKEVYNSDRAEFIVLYGRRRIGKTELIKKSIDKENAIYLFIEEALETENLDSFKTKIAKLLTNPLIEKAELSWEELFDEIAKEDRLVVVFDEFPNLIKENKTILSKFQKIWDEKLAKSKIKLIICGSSISMMENHLLGYKTPVYGRRTGQLFLQPLKFFHIKDFIELPFKEIIEIYGITDGIPYYILDVSYRLKNGEKLEEIFQPGKILFEEAEILIKNELRDPTRYYKILKAISFGYTRFGEIVSYTGFKQTLISQYLSNLINLHIIKESFPLTEKKERTRNRKYVFSDNYFNFYFRFIYSNKSELLQEGSIENFKIKYNQYMGLIFEKACKEFLIENKIRLPFKFTEIGGWWKKDKEIDLVCLNRETREILFTECKWKNLKAGQAKKLLEGLRGKAEFVDWNQDEQKEFFGLIAKKIEGKERLRDDGYYVFDLKDFEAMTRK